MNLRLFIFFSFFLGVLSLGCSQKKGERCQVDSDCEKGLYCAKPYGVEREWYYDGICCPRGKRCLPYGDAGVDAAKDALSDKTADKIPDKIPDKEKDIKEETKD
jgi:hypothetical protein